MPDFTVSAAMDAFLTESDPANVLLPLTGGTMNAGADIAFANGSMLREGTTDAGNGGAGGIAQVCSISYELKWEAGRLYVMEQDGFTIRVEQYGFTYAPTAGDDDTKGYIVGSQRILDDGTIYVCTDATTGAALWVPVIGFSSRRLYAPNGTPALEWGVDFSTGDYGIAFGYDGMGGFYHLLNSQGINWAGGSWYDGTTIGYGGLTAIDISGRLLVDSSGSAAYNWESGQIGHSNALRIDVAYSQLLGDSASQSVDWNLRYLNDGAGVSVDWYGRQLIANDGTTVMLDWSNPSVGLDAYSINTAQGYTTQGGAAVFLSGFDAGSNSGVVGSLLTGVDLSSAISVDYRQLIGTDGVTVALDWSNGTGIQANAIIRDSSNNDTIDPTNRLLTASDGSTVAVDWSSGIPVTPRVTVTPNTVAALTGGEGTIAYVNDADTPVTHGQPVVGGGVEKALVCFNGTDWIIVSHLS